jgi:opacity protein-like surface antigen
VGPAVRWGQDRHDDDRRQRSGQHYPDRRARRLRVPAEGEFNYRISGGDWDYGFGPASATTEFKLWTIAGYFAYRYPVGDNLFLKGKAGILYENVDAEVTLDYMGEHYSYYGGGTDTGLSIGAGVGMKLSEKLTGEVEFTVIESDVNYLSVGLNMAL